jgi:hypothetical protein
VRNTEDSSRKRTEPAPEQNRLQLKFFLLKMTDAMDSGMFLLTELSEQKTGIWSLPEYSSPAPFQQRKVLVIQQRYPPGQGFVLSKLKTKLQ